MFYDLSGPGLVVKHKSTTKKYTDEEFFATIHEDDRREIIDAYLENNCFNDPDGLFRCEICEKVLKFEWFNESYVQEICMDCDKKLYCCHYPDRDYWVADAASDKDCGSYGCPSSGEDGRDCTCLPDENQAQLPIEEVPA